LKRRGTRELSELKESSECRRANLRHPAPHNRHPELDSGSRGLATKNAKKEKMDSPIKSENDNTYGHSCLGLEPVVTRPLYKLLTERV